MKFVFSLLIALAVSAISLDVVLKFVDSSELLASGESSNEDGDADDQSEDSPEDDEQLKTKEFYWNSHEEVFAAFPASVTTTVNTHIAIFIDHPLQATPFSPPELT